MTACNSSEGFIRDGGYRVPALVRWEAIVSRQKGLRFWHRGAGGSNHARGRYAIAISAV